MGRNRGLLAGLLLAGLSAPAAAQYSESVAGWEIAGADGICLGVGPVVAGNHVAIGIGGGGFHLSANSTRFSYGSVRSLAVTLAIDDRWERRMSATVDLEDLLLFEFDLSDPFIDHLRAGNVLRVDTGQAVFKVGLSGSSAAIAALWECGRQVGAPTGAATAVPAAPAGPNDPSNEFRIGSWLGEAYFHDDGRFAACMVFGPEDGPVLLLLSRSPLGFEIGLQNDDWALADGARYPVSVAVDDRWRADLEAQAIGTGSVVIALDGAPTALDHLRRGSRLTVTAAQQVFRFDLSGSSAAIGALADCYAVRTGEPEVAAAPVPPPAEASGSTPPGPELSTGVYRRPLAMRQADVEELILSRVAPSGRVWINNETPPFFEFYGNRGVRDGGPVWGQVIAVSVPSGLIELAMLALYADRVAECGDGGESGLLPAESYAGLDLQYAVIQCGTEPGDRQVELVLMLIGTDGALYVIEGGYTDTYRMADLVLAIQTLGRAVAE